MENKPFFIDEKELAALKNNSVEPKEEPKTISIEEMQTEEEIKEPVMEVVEETKEVQDEIEKTSTNLVVTKPTDITKKDEDSPKLKINLQLFSTIMACIIVAYLFLGVARSFYYGFKYYDCAHVDYNCDEDTNTQK